MKKKVLLTSLLAVTTIVLASCGNNNVSYNKIKVSKPNDKGAKVSSIDKEYEIGNKELKINDKMQFSEIYDAVYDVSYMFSTYHEENTPEYISQYELRKINYQESNILNVNYPYGFSLNTETTVEERYNANDFYKNVSETDTKYNSEVYKYSLKYDNKKINNNNSEFNTVSKEEIKELSKFESNINDNITTETLEHGYNESNYSNINIKYDNDYQKVKLKTSNGYYINASESSNDDNFDATYYGIDKNDQDVEYTISDKSEDFYYNITQSISNLYRKSYDEFYNTSYELTEKYIILKTECRFTDEIYDESIISDSILKSDYNGSNQQIEVWLTYNTDGLYLAYYKSSSITYYNVNNTYTEGYINAYKSYDFYDDMKKIIGKTYSKKGTKAYECEISTFSNDKIENKFKSGFNYCKNNNDYKDIKFIPGKITY